MLRLLTLIIAAVAAAAAAGQFLPGTAPFLDGTPPVMLGAIVAISTMLLIDLSSRALTDGRTESQIRRLIAKSEALELELAAMRAGAPLSDHHARPDETPLPAQAGAPSDSRPVEPAAAMPNPTAAAPEPRGPKRSLRALDLHIDPEPVPQDSTGTQPIDQTLRDSVREALRADRISLHVQPIVDMSDRMPRAYECISLLRTATGNLMTPQTYMPAVEAEGLTAAIDNMLLLRCVQVVRNAQRNETPLRFFCKIASQSLQDRVFFADFLDFASDNALLSDHLVFQIDHQTLATLPPDARGDLQALANLGYRFALDNANLDAIDAALLTDHRVAYVKSRLADLSERATRDRHLIDLERPLLLAGSELIATQVDRESHLSVVANLPVPFGQGLLFGESAPIETLRQR